MSSLYTEAPDPDSRHISDIALLRRLLGYVLEHPILFTVAAILYPLTAAAVVLPPYLVREILDTVIPARDLDQLYRYGGLYLAAVVGEYITGVGSQFAMSVLGQRAMRNLRNEVFAHVQKLPARYFDRNPVGRILTRLTNDVEALTEVFATGAITVIGDIITVIFVLVMMFWIDVRLTLYSLLVVPPLVLLTYIFRRFARRAFRGIRRHLARINAFLGEHIEQMNVVQVFGQQRRTAREFGELNLAYRDSNRSAILYDALLYSIVEAIGTTAVAAILWLGASDLSTGVAGAGTFIALVQYIRRLFVPIRDLSTKYTVLQSAFAAAERIFSLRDEAIPIASPEVPRTLQSPVTTVELRDVWFAYGDDHAANGWVLRGLNLQLQKGEKVALVGATGCGKTTILKLLNRSYDVSRGSIQIDGTDIRELELRRLRRLFAVVLQDVYLFSGTILDNLRIDEADPEDVKRAARAVQADEFIKRLADGYDTLVGKGGERFSAGERQLLAFARALARDPEILVLDEATSNVDSETEAKLQTALDVLLRERTAVIVAHRLSTIRKVDRIVVLQGGRVAEEGSHDVLVARGGLYSKLVELQFGTR